MIRQIHPARQPRSSGSSSPASSSDAATHRAQGRREGRGLIPPALPTPPLGVRPDACVACVRSVDSGAQHFANFFRPRRNTPSERVPKQAVPLGFESLHPSHRRSAPALRLHPSGSSAPALRSRGASSSSPSLGDSSRRAFALRTLMTVTLYPGREPSLKYTDTRSTRPTRFASLPGLGVHDPL